MEEVVDVVAYDEGVVRAGEVHELVPAGERHGFAGRVGAGGDEVDDVAVELAVGVGVFGGVVLGELV